MNNIFKIRIKGKNGMTLKDFCGTIQQLIIAIDEFCQLNGINKNEIMFELLSVKEGSVCLEIKLPTIDIDKLIGVKILQDFILLVDIRKRVSELSSNVQVIKEDGVNKLEDENGECVTLNDEEFNLYTFSNKLDKAMSKLCKTIYEDPEHYGIDFNLGDNLKVECNNDDLKKSSIYRKVEDYRKELIQIENFELWVNIIEASFDFSKKWKIEGVENKIKYDVLVKDKAFIDGVTASNIHLVKKLKMKVRLENKYKEEKNKKKLLESNVISIIEKDYGNDGIQESIF